ncbi:MAG TPA: PQQ-binding-like beta-propeller repeat protein [Planctomycetota bacterium]|jgi:outer membrane protein assembly factor BamB
MRIALHLISAILMTSVLAADWPQFRGPNRDGKSTETGLLTQWPDDGPPRLWKIDGLGSGYGHPAIAGQTIFTAGMVHERGTLRACSLDGYLKWQADYGPEWSRSYPGARCTPTVHDGRVYVTSAVGSLACFDAVTGKRLWSCDVFKKFDAQETLYGWSESPLIVGENVICSPCGGKGTLVALNRKTGETAWTGPTYGSAFAYCSPMLLEHQGKRMIVTMLEFGVDAFSPDNGERLWHFDYQNPRQNHCNTPIFSDGMLYITSGHGRGAVGLALNKDGDGVEEVWRQDLQDPMHGQAILIDGYVYASSHTKCSGDWTCIDFKTGKLAWQHEGVGHGGCATYADGLLYCYCEDGIAGIVRPSPQKCDVVSRLRISDGDGMHWAHPVIAHGRLFIRHGDVLLCYDIRRQRNP